MLAVSLRAAVCQDFGEDILSPDKSLTKMWKLSENGDEDEDEDVEAFDDEREVRMLVDRGGRL